LWRAVHDVTATPIRSEPSSKIVKTGRAYNKKVTPKSKRKKKNIQRKHECKNVKWKTGQYTK
jgi:hypothetical protein